MRPCISIRACVRPSVRPSVRRSVRNAFFFQIEEKMGEPIEVPPSFMEELKDGLEDLVHDTISTMQPPNAADHVMGAIAQLIQMKAMQKFGMVPQIDEEARSKIDPNTAENMV